MTFKKLNFIKLSLLALVFLLNINDVQSQEQTIEDVIVTAEKRDESLQTVSQAVTAITDSELEAKNITSFVDLTALVPGVTVAKNEGYKTVISIRGVGNETNQNAIAAPSVAYLMDGIFVASPFALQPQRWRASSLQTCPRRTACRQRTAPARRAFPSCPCRPCRSGARRPSASGSLRTR